MTNMTPYKAEILSQPSNIRNVLTNFDARALDDLRKYIKIKKFERIIMTGMGASFFSLYPAWLDLALLGIPVIHVDIAELIHYADAYVTEKTLLWVVSQSGRTAELEALLDKNKFLPGFFLATVNDLTSPLAQRADLFLSIHAEVEKTVSTRTYVNSLVVNRLTALSLLGKEVSATIQTFAKTADLLEEYLQRFEETIRVLKAQIGIPPHLILIGRGASLASAWMGALMMQEAAKFPAFASNAGQFRHGPLEMVDSKITAIVMAGSPLTRDLNKKLLLDLLKYGAKGYFLTDEEEKDIPTITIPRGEEIALPLLEIVPLQCLSISLAELSGLEAGKFFRLGKITQEE
ncbi:MAG: SIS domain-containing protein [Anaerolineales bacterium]